MLTKPMTAAAYCFRIRMPARRANLPIALLTALVVFGSPAASALGLGAPVQQSPLGQPLRLVIPVLAAPGEELSGDCFRLAPGGRDADGVAQVVQARVTLERSASGPVLVVVSSRAVNEPIVRVAVQAGCDTVVRRDYTLLLDPPAIEPASVAAEPAPAVAPPGGPSAAADRAPAVAGAADSAPRASGRSTTGRTRPGTGALPKKSRPPKRAAGGRGTPSATGKPAPLPKKPPRETGRPPRLTISAAPPAGAAPTAAAGGGDEATRAAKAQEVVNALEAETAVLRQRVAELSDMVDRMQAEMKATTAARLAAEDAARRSPLAIATRWWESSWPVLAALLGLAALLAAALRRRRRLAGPVGEWPITSPPPPHLVQPSEGRGSLATATGSFGIGEELPPVAAPVPVHPAGGDRAPRRVDAAQAVAVSELSHVTEEARVYLALDRPDRAMSVLREHIADQPRSMPAAWLMLLDLYHTYGKEKDFNEVAQAFHQQFNAQTPTFATYPEHEANDAGIEAFPHIVRQLVNLWGTEDCRSYLERLLFDNRQGRRTGFSLVAYDDILTLRQLIEHLLAMAPEIDREEEAKLRAAWAAAQQAEEPVPATAQSGAKLHRSPLPAREAPPTAAPLMLDLELDLDSVFSPDPIRCCLESDYPTLLSELSASWGEPAVARQLRDLLVSEKKGGPQLSPEAVSELILLQRIALELSGPAGGARRDADSDGTTATRH